MKKLRSSDPWSTAQGHRATGTSQVTVKIMQFKAFTLTYHYHYSLLGEVSKNSDIPLIIF